MRNTKRFPFVERSDRARETNVFPYLPIALSYQDYIVDALALLNTGSSLNVSPYHIGLAFAWTKSNVPPIILGQLNFFMEFDDEK